MVISFIPPFFIAYGINYNAPCLFYLVLILTFVPFLLITSGIGITIAHLLTRVFSIKKLRLYLLAIGLLLFISIYLLFRSQWSISPESPENFFYSLLSIKTDSPVMPSFWITESVMPLLKHQSPDIRYPLLIFSAGVSMLLLSGIAGNLLYRNNIERILPTTKHGIKISTGGIYPGRNLALLWKDIKIFFRDAGQWSQLFIISALIFIYIYNFRTLPIKTISEIFPFMKELMVLINMLMAGLVLTAVSARFLYSSISLEGMAFWIIRTSPVTVKKLLWSKFLYGFIPITVMLFAVVFVTNMAMQIDTFLVVLSVATILILCISISGLGTGMGAIYPKFRYENVASISMNPGGMFFMLIAFLVVLLTISIEAWSFYLYKKAVLSGMEMSFIQKGYCIVAGFFIIFINGLAFYLPMRMGKKRLEEDLIL
jgi:ABC-2 type transport system permease protein